MNRSARRVGGAIAVIGLLAAGAVAYQYVFLAVQSKTAPAGPPPGVPVAVATVARQSMPIRVDMIGTVQTIANVAIRSRIDGYIDKVLVHDGQFVKAGDMMFELDRRAAQAQLQQAQAQLLRDKASLDGAERDLKRNSDLVAKGATPIINLDAAKTQVGVFDGAVKADEAAIENLKVQLSFCTISAPIDGRIGLIAIKDGNSIKANDVPLATINQIQPIYVSFALPQADLPALKTAMDRGPVEVSVRAQGDQGPATKGLVEFYDSAVDSSTGTIAVRAKFANEDLRLWPGQYVNTSVSLGAEPDVLIVPQTAVQVGQNGNYVFVIKADRAEIRPVKAMRTIDGKSVIGSGLNEGEEVAIDGQLRLGNGTRVEIKKL